jgi:hypothetical protein
MSLSRASDRHPACFPLADVRAEGYPVAAGGFGDIRQGFVLGEIVAIKVMRIFRNEEVETCVKVVSFYSGRK